MERRSFMATVVCLLTGRKPTQGTTSKPTQSFEVTSELGPKLSLARYGSPTPLHPLTLKGYV